MPEDKKKKTIDEKLTDRRMLYIMMVIVLMFTIKESVVFWISGDSYAKAEYAISEKVVIHDAQLQALISYCNTTTFQDPVTCIITQFNDFPIKYHNNPFIKTASEMKQTGMVCRDYSVNICTALKELGYRCEYFLTPDHVLPIINRDTNFMYCRQVSAHEMYCD